MKFIKDDDGVIRLPIILPPLNLCLYLITVALGRLMPLSPYPGRGMFAVDMPFSFAMFSSDSATTLVIVAVLGTGWWYLIGRIGYDAGKAKNAGSAFGVLLTFLVGANGTLICVYYLIEDFRGDVAARSALIQYVPALLLCAGAFTSMFYEATSLRRGRGPAR